MPRSQTRANSDSGMSDPIEKTEIPFTVRGSEPSLAAGNKHAPSTPAMRACEGPLKSASRIAIRRPADATRPRDSVKVLLPTPPLPEPTATRWRTPATLRDASPLLATCSRIWSSVADDVVVALHRDVTYTAQKRHRTAPSASGPLTRLDLGYGVGSHRDCLSCSE